MGEATITLKAAYEGEWRRTSVDASVAYESLCDKLRHMYHISGPLRLTYVDEENDKVTIASDYDLKETIKVAARMNNTLKLTVELADAAKSAQMSSPIESEAWDFAGMSRDHDNLVSMALNTVSPEAGGGKASEPTEIKSVSEHPVDAIEAESCADSRGSSTQDAQDKETDEELSILTFSSSYSNKKGIEDQLGASIGSPSECHGVEDLANSHLDDDAVDLVLHPLSVGSNSTLPIHSGSQPVLTPTEDLPAYGQDATNEKQPGSDDSTTEQTAAAWFEHVINEGQFHRLIVQTRLEHEWASFASDARVSAVVADVYHRLKSTAQFTERQLIQVRNYLLEALHRMFPKRSRATGRTSDSVGNWEGASPSAGQVHGAVEAEGDAREQGQKQDSKMQAVAQGNLGVSESLPLDHKDTREQAPQGHYPTSRLSGTLRSVGMEAATNPYMIWSSLNAQNMPADCKAPNAEDIPAGLESTAVETDSPVTARDYVKYQTQLELLMEMGFAEDWEVYVRLLRQTDGNVNVVANRLLSDIA